MKTLLVLMLSTIVFLAGCAGLQTKPKTWYKSGATEEQFNRDMMSCRQYGMQSAQTNGLSGNLFVETWIQNEANNCMTRFGYH